MRRVHAGDMIQVCLILLATGCASAREGTSSRELGRIQGPEGGIRYCIQPGGFIQKARLAHEAEARFGALVVAAPEGEAGVEIVDVIHGGPAEAAAFLPGDRLLHLGDTVLDTVEAFREAVLRVPGGGRVGVRFQRRGQIRERSLCPCRDREAMVDQELLAGQEPFLEARLAGLEVVALSPEMKREIYGSEVAGLVVSAVVPGAPAYRAGIRAGDRLVAVQGSPVHTPSDLRSLLACLEPGGEIRARVEKKNTRFEETVRLEDVKDRDYIDVPLLLRYSSGSGDTGLTLGVVLFDYNARYRNTTRREGHCNLDLSLVLGLIRWRERNDQRELRLLWVIPISL